MFLAYISFKKSNSNALNDPIFYVCGSFLMSQSKSNKTHRVHLCFLLNIIFCLFFEKIHEEFTRCIIELLENDISTI